MNFKNSIYTFVFTVGSLPFKTNLLKSKPWIRRPKPNWQISYLRTDYNVVSFGCDVVAETLWTKPEVVAPEPTVGIPSTCVVHWKLTINFKTSI